MNTGGMKKSNKMTPVTDFTGVTDRLGDQRGYIAVVTLMLIPVFLILAALVINTGYLLAQKAEIQGIADALALASASGVYRKAVEAEQEGPGKQVTRWDWFINPKLARQESFRFLDYVMSHKEQEAPGNHRGFVSIEEITVDPTEKRVMVKVKAQARSGLMQWSDKRYIYATASAGLNTGGGRKPVPRVDGLP